MEAVIKPDNVILQGDKMPKGTGYPKGTKSGGKGTKTTHNPPVKKGSGTKKGK